MAKSSSPDAVVAHAVVGAVAAGISHAVVPIRNRGDYIVRAVVGALLSAALLSNFG